MKTKRIFSLSLARKLQEMGNFIIKTEDNKDKIGFKVFVFLNDDKFKEDLQSIITQE